MNTSALEQDWDSDMFANGSLIDWSEFSAEHALKFPGTRVGLIEEFQEPYRFGTGGPMRFVTDNIDFEDDDPE